MVKTIKFPWWRRITLPWYKWRVVQTVLAADAVPTRLPAKCAVLVKNQFKPGWLVFDCPCRRGHRVMLNLSLNRHPRWLIKKTLPLTISPSVNDFTIDTSCHYFIHEGRIKWMPYTNNKE